MQHTEHSVNTNRRRLGVPALALGLSLAASLGLLGDSASRPASPDPRRAPGFDVEASQGLDAVQPAIFIVDLSGQESPDEEAYGVPGSHAACTHRIQCLFAECRSREPVQPSIRSRCLPA
jgi:hypothetical protein